MVRSLWAGIVVLFAIAFIYAVLTPHTLRDQIDRAAVTSFPSGGVWEVGGSRIVLLDVAGLGSGKVGLHFAVAPDPGHPWNGSLTPSGATASESPGQLESWFEVAAPADGRIVVEVRRTGSCGSARSCVGSFTVDLATLHVPSNLWR